MMQRELQQFHDVFKSKCRAKWATSCEGCYKAPPPTPKGVLCFFLEQQHYLSGNKMCLVEEKFNSNHQFDPLPISQNLAKKMEDFETKKNKASIKVYNSLCPCPFTDCAYTHTCTHERMHARTRQTLVIL